MHPGQVWTSCVLIRRMHPPLARHDSTTEDVPDHSWSVQSRPVDQGHQFQHLTNVLRPICPVDPLLWDLADVTECGATRFLLDIEPPLVPFGKGGVPWAAEVAVLRTIVKIEVYTTCNLGASNRSLLPQAEQVTEEIKVRLCPNIGLA